MACEDCDKVDITTVVARVTVTPAPAQVNVVAQEPLVNVTAPPEVTVVVESLTPDIIITPNPSRVVISEAGHPGPPGPPSPGSLPELYDSLTPPVGAPFPYVRFERDLDGHVQMIYLGTVD